MLRLTKEESDRLFRSVEGRAKGQKKPRKPSEPQNNSGKQHSARSNSMERQFMPCYVKEVIFTDQDRVRLRKTLDRISRQVCETINTYQDLEIRNNEVTLYTGVGNRKVQHSIASQAKKIHVHFKKLVKGDDISSRAERVADNDTVHVYIYDEHMQSRKMLKWVIAHEFTHCYLTPTSKTPEEYILVMMAPHDRRPHEIVADKIAETICHYTRADFYRELGEKVEGRVVNPERL
jgi:hypothetical protein